jgi:hypothetical protein
LDEKLPQAGWALHPELLDASWHASATRLSELLSNYELVADLATFYSRLEELRWRIRFRTQAQSSILDEMTHKLAHEMVKEMDDVLG